MPKKRDLETRIEEAKEKLERLELEQNIKKMKVKFGSKRKRRR